MIESGKLRRHMSSLYARSNLSNIPYSCCLLFVQVYGHPYKGCYEIFIGDSPIKESFLPLYVSIPLFLFNKFELVKVSYISTKYLSIVVGGHLKSRPILFVNPTNEVLYTGILHST